MKQKKQYTFVIRSGRATLQLTKPDANGRIRSISCEYPFVDYDGPVHRKLSRKQVETMLADRLGVN